jgi:hypothetical protein
MSSKPDNVKTVLLLFFLSCCLSACSQEDSTTGFRSEVTDRQWNIGESFIVVRHFVFAHEAPYLFVHLHADESTAATVAAEAAHRWGIPLIQVLNNNRRNIPFVLGDTTFHFDPNRIFSIGGIEATVKPATSSQQVLDEVRVFRDSLLRLIVQNKPVVALHNNTDRGFSILTYHEGNMGTVHINEALDKDDFIITNDETIFQRLREENFNVVLEDASRIADDGSLSLYASREGMRYVNIEAEHGHHQQQRKMLEAVHRIFK